MPIDPSILQGLKPIQIEDPLSLYTNYLAARGGQNQLAKFEQDEQDRNALNAAMKEYATGGYDAVIKRLGATSGHQVPGVLTLKTAAEKAALENLKTRDEMKTAGVNRQKTQSEIVAKKLEFFNNRLAGVATPQDALTLNTEMYTDPDVRDFLTGIGGSLEKGAAEIQQAAADPTTFGTYLKQRQNEALGLEKVLKQHFVNEKFDLGGKMVGRTLTMPEYGTGPATVVPGSTFEAKITESPNRPRETKIVLPGEKAKTKYGETLGGEIAKRDMDWQNEAMQASIDADDTKRILNMLVSDDPVFTGQFADFRLGAAKAFNVVAETDEQAIRNTEALTAQLAKNTLAQIKILGIGARGIDTPAERKFLENFAGKPEMNRGSLIHLLKLSHEASRRIADRWNKRGPRIPKDEAAAVGLDTNPIDIPAWVEPKRPAPVARPAWKPGDPPPQAAIEYLKKNPGTRATFEKTYGELGKRAAKDALDTIVVPKQGPR